MPPFTVVCSSTSNNHHRSQAQNIPVPVTAHVLDTREPTNYIQDAVPVAMASHLAAMAQILKRTTNTTTTSNPHSTITPYTHGLEGVNLDVDNSLSTAISTGMGILVIIIFVIRIGQWTNAHLRKCLNLSTDPVQQNYWSIDRTMYWPWIKRNVFYAPLNRKRHNREFQITRAYNVGTLPSRLHTILLGGYFFFNIVATCYLDFTVPNKAKLIAELRGRSGHLSVLNMLPLFLFAGRNNIFIQLLRVSFDTWNLFHRWIGRIVVVEAVVHTITWAINEFADVGAHKADQRLTHNAFLQWGLAAMIAMSIIMVQSISIIRHAAYETFLHLHQLLAFVALLGVWYHAQLGVLPQFVYIKWILAIWVVERFARLARIVYRNLGWRSNTRVIVEALPSDACRVTFELVRPWRYTPGCHVYAYIPGVSLWMSHPFSIAWHEQRPTPYLSLEDGKLPSTNSDLDIPLPGRTTTSISLIMAKRSGMTEKLYNKARASPTGIITLRGAVEGPYGGLESLHSYGTVILFAGGVGITHQLSHVRDLLEGYETGTVATRKIVLIWSVRQTEQLDWVRPWMDEILSMESRREVLKVLIHVTQPRNPQEVRSRSEKVLMFPGRANARSIIAAEMDFRVGAAVATVCGPGAFADEVRAAARDNMYKGTLDFVEESFTW